MTMAVAASVGSCFSAMMTSDDGGDEAGGDADGVHAASANTSALGIGGECIIAHVRAFAYANSVANSVCTTGSDTSRKARTPRAYM